MVRTIRHYLWASPKQYVMIEANVIRARVKINAEGHKRARYHDELQMSPEQVSKALEKHRLMLDSTDRDEIHQNSTNVFYVLSAPRCKVN